MGGNTTELTDVRKSFLRNAKVRLIWKKHLRAGKFFNPSHYATAVDKFIQKLESSSEAIVEDDNRALAKRAAAQGDSK